MHFYESAIVSVACFQSASRDQHDYFEVRDWAVV